MSKKPPRPVHYCACGDHAFSPLTKGFMAMVSIEDAHLLQIRWRVHLGSGNRGGYATILSPGGGEFILSRMITKAPKGMKVDHANRDTMDNRRSNLRLCTHAENMANRKATRGKALPKGVRRSRKKFIAQIYINGERKYLGTYSTAEAAANAYNAVALAVHGEFARAA
jgi:hypothetical protein